MRWTRMLVQLKHSHSAASSTFPNLNFHRASISNLPKKRGPPENPNSDQACDTPHSEPQGQARASLQSSPATAKASTASCLKDNTSSCQSEAASITISSRTVATSKSSGRPSPNRFTKLENARSSASEYFRPEGRRKEAVDGSEKNAYKANVFSPNSADKSCGDVSKNSTNAVNHKNGKPLSVIRSVVGNTKLSEGEISDARVSETIPSHKAEPRDPSFGSELPSKNVSIPPVGEKSVVGAPVNEKPENSRSHVSVDDEGKTAKVVSACTLTSSPPSETSTGFDDKDQEGSKKPFVASFPVKVLCDWWLSCYAQVCRPYYTSLTHPFNKLYFWLAAYQRAHFDVTGHYTDGQSAEYLREQLLKLLNDVLDGRFQWADKKILYLPTPVGHNEELSPIFQDRVVNEVFYLVLEPIFEARFSPRSHGFRPGRDVHTALRAVRRNFLGCRWFMKGSLSKLHTDKYANLLVDSALRVLRDTRLACLLKSGFLGQEGGSSACMFSDQGSYSKLRNLLCNVFLNQLDWFMDEQILSFCKRDQLSFQSPSNSLFKLVKTKKERQRRLEYIRYGTDILLACNGTREEADLVQKSINSYFKEKFSMDVGKQFTINHISDGVEFLDHAISLRISHPVTSRRRASNGRVSEKRAHRIRLSINASREFCAQYLKQIETPSSLQHIEEILLVLNSWYRCAENRSKVMEFCKWTLCYAYAKGLVKNCEEECTDLSGKVKKAMEMVGDEGKLSDGEKESATQDFFWVPEHEYCLKDHAWLKSQSSEGLIAALKNSRVVSPQQCMQEITWRSLGDAAHASNGGGDGSWETDFPVQWSQGNLAEAKLEDAAEVTG